MLFCTLCVQWRICLVRLRVRVCDDPRRARARTETLQLSHIADRERARPCVLNDFICVAGAGAGANAPNTHSHIYNKIEMFAADERARDAQTPLTRRTRRPALRKYARFGTMRCERYAAHRRDRRACVRACVSCGAVVEKRLLKDAAAAAAAAAVAAVAAAVASGGGMSIVGGDIW